MYMKFNNKLNHRIYCINCEMCYVEFPAKEMIDNVHMTVSMNRCTYIQNTLYGV